MLHLGTPCSTREKGGGEQKKDFGVCTLVFDGCCGSSVDGGEAEEYNVRTGVGERT